MALIKFENEDKLFIKFFLLDSSVNLNTWGVTRSAMIKGLKTFIGKPFVITPDYGHPNASSGDDLLIQQEKYRVGDIIDVGIDAKSDKAYGVAEITDPQAKDIIKNGVINFVSPSIVFNDYANVTDKDGNSIITEFEGAHVAGVAEPAYGIDKAEIKGKCIGSKESCDLTLQKVEAKVSDCGNYLTVKNGKYGNIDQESLQNITKIKLMKKKGMKKSEILSEMDKHKKKTKKTQKELDEDYEVQMQSFSKDRKGVTEEEYKKKTDKYTSNKPKKSKKINNMTQKKSQEEKEDEEADETPEEDRVKRGQSLEEQLKDKEETDIMKSEEEKDEEDATEDEDEKEATHKKGEDKEDEEAEDEDKLDLTNKQKEFLRDSKLAKQVRVLRAELKAMKSKIRRAEIEPIIQDILDAKSLVGKIDARSEYRKLSKLDISTLRELQAHYDTIKEAKTTPRYVVRNASLDSSDKSADNLLLSMRGDF